MVGWGIVYGYEKGRVPVMGMRSRGGGDLFVVVVAGLYLGVSLGGRDGCVASRVCALLLWFVSRDSTQGLYVPGTG